MGITIEAVLARWPAGGVLGNLPGDLLPRRLAALVLAGYAVVLAINAATTSVRRDVT